MIKKKYKTGDPLPPELLNALVLTEAPSTLSFDGEEDKRFYFGIHV